MSRPRVSDEQLVELYAEHGSVWKVAAIVHLSGQNVHKRLRALGVAKPVNVFTDEDRDRLRRDYVNFRSMGRVADLAEDMGRTVQFLSRQAKTLGLTDASYDKQYAGVWKYMTEESATVLWDEFKTSGGTLHQFCARHDYDRDSFRRTMMQFFDDEWEHVIEAKAPRETMYRRGRRLEYRARDWLKRRGFFVLRSPASRSPLDLVAISPGRVLFVQCKVGGALPPREWNEIFDLALSVEATPVLCSSPTGYGLAFYELTGRKDGSRRAQPMTVMDDLTRRARVAKEAS